MTGQGAAGSFGNAGLNPGSPRPLPSRRATPCGWPLVFKHGIAFDCQKNWPAALFAALHNRWAEAFVAGLVSWVMRRNGRVGAAIAAHAVVFVYALASGQMYII